ncbi:MAG: zinc ribbon domain-containing protein, partial [Chloroflexi bacterium]|nr:zinc ribbon domain-containing protein [Chloroflexota bacterium]
LLACGLCGAALVGEHSSMVKRNDGYHRNPWYFYRCIHTRKGECSLSRLDAHKLEKAIIDDLLNRVLTSANLDRQRSDIIRESSKERPELVSREQLLSKQLRDINAQIDRLVDAIETTGVSERITDRIKSREADKIRLERDLSAVRLKLDEPQAPDYHRVEELRGLIENAYKAGNTNELRDILRGILLKVIVTREEVRIEYHFPFVSTVLRGVPQREFESRSLADIRCSGMQF